MALVRRGGRRVDLCRFWISRGFKMERRRMTRQQDTRLTAEKTFFFCFVFGVCAPLSLFLSLSHSDYCFAYVSIWDQQETHEVHKQWVEWRRPVQPEEECTLTCILSVSRVIDGSGRRIEVRRTIKRSFTSSIVDVCLCLTLSFAECRSKPKE